MGTESCSHILDYPCNGRYIARFKISRRVGYCRFILDPLRLSNLTMFAISCSTNASFIHNDLTFFSYLSEDPRIGINIPEWACGRPMRESTWPQLQPFRAQYNSNTHSISMDSSVLVLEMAKATVPDTPGTDRIARFWLCTLSIAL